ncbi:hypothetical protein ACIA58_41090 [Kribbella sp. NPDC051586]|uniref:hypothetical protein n=1 Tax=Kribbella sp. NPDC051586 TaxID=3364118 RepID=UPI0037AC00CD
MADKFSSVDDYIASFPPDVREILEQVRRTVRAVVPAAGEKISHQIPAITLDGTRSTSPSRTTSSPA